MLILPAIDLKDGRCVRLLRGAADQETVFSEHPVAMARKWRDLGAQYLHIVDLDGAFHGAPKHLDIVAAIVRETCLPVQIGGGIRQRDTILRYLDAGVDRVIIGTKALESPAWLAALCEELPGRIAAGVDARDGRVAVRGWVETTEITALQLAAQLKPMQLGAVIFTDISRDGTLEGPSVESTRAFAQALGRPVIASGGIGALDQIRALAALPLAGIVIGRALYSNAFTLPEALAAARETQAPPAPTTAAPQ